MRTVLQTHRPADAYDGALFSRLSAGFIHAARRVARAIRALQVGGRSSRRRVGISMPTGVLSGMLAVPPIALLGWLGLLLPTTTLLHPVVGALLMGTLLMPGLAITGAHIFPRLVPLARQLGETLPKLAETLPTLPMGLSRTNYSQFADMGLDCVDPSEGTSS